MRAEIVSIGTELLLGTITDTNASYLAQRLATLGIDCYYVSQVGDNLGRLVDTLGRALQRSDLVITTGGLGPTQDDLTREAISALLDEPMVVQPDLERDLRAFFQRRGVEMPERNLKQATVIASAEVLPNPLGTAPGWWVSRAGEGGTRVIVSMPGVPYEMKRMWENEVEPRLVDRSRGVILSRTLKTLGLGESAVEARVQDLMDGANPTLAPYAKQDGVHLRITAKAPNSQEAEGLIAGLESQVRARLGEAIYGTDDDTPQSVVRTLLLERGYRYTLLEVGPAVVGSLAPLLGDAQPPEMGLCVGLLSIERLTALSQLFGRDKDWPAEPDLETAVRVLQAKSGANIVLAVGADSTPADADWRIINV